MDSHFSAHDGGVQHSGIAGEGLLKLCRGNLQAFHLYEFLNKRVSRLALQ